MTAKRLAQRGQKHPRLRGEDRHVSALWELKAETPPLTRGRRRRSFLSWITRRNTPAYAGKTVMAPRWMTCGGKHPRLRGEDSKASGGCAPLEETPPLTRGRPSTQSTDSHASRNTPAYAGKTCSNSQELQRSSKHPRLRGEDLNFSPYSPQAKETPPLTRGRQKLRTSRRRVVRNTPAYAGKTQTKPDLLEPAWKHPRLRGEDSNICEMLILKNTTYC